MSTMKLIAVTLTAAVVLKGEIVKAGETVEVPEKIAKNLLYRKKAELADGDVLDDEDKDLEDMTVAELKQLATDLGLDLGANTKKADLIAAIDAAGDQGEGEGE